MRLIDLRANQGARRKKKRVGRGIGSGHGKTSCRGNNGQGQHDGKGRKPGFEGGQTPLYRRFPKFQVNERPNKLEWTIINLSCLEKLTGCKEITPSILLEKEIIDKLRDGVKVLGEGELKSPITVKAHKFSEAAKKKIEAAGGKWEEIRK